MRIISSIKIAIKSMRANILRTGLTVLGMVIGTASIIIVFSAGEGIKGLVLGQIESFGTDILETEVKVPSSKKGMAADTQSGVSMVMGVQITTLVLDDMDDIDKLPNVKQSYAGIMSQEQVSFGSELRKAIIFGTNASYIDIDKSEIGTGRFFSDAEDRSLARVAVLGSKMKEKLFGDSEAIGRFIKIRQSKYRIIGVMEERGAIMTMDFDDFVYLPIRTLQKRIMGVNHVLYMVHQLYNLDLADETAEEVRWILRDNHNIDGVSREISGLAPKDDFRVVTMEEMMEILGTITGAITLLLLVIVIISLIVGGVGIMNIMYVIISERTAEIGLRKAVGAKFSDIVLQFLIESVLVAVLGSLVGVALGVVASFAIALGAGSFGMDWRFIIPLKSFMVAMGFSIVFGVLFGIYPARKAARLDPIEALQKE